VVLQQTEQPEGCFLRQKEEAMKTLLITALAACVMVFPAAYAGDFGASVSTRVLSQDLSYFGGLSLDRPVQETDIYISLPWGFYVDFWHSMGLNDSDLSSDAGDEVDLTVGWAGMVAKRLSVNAAISHYDYDNLFNEKGGDSISPYVEASLPMKIAGYHCLEPYVLFELDFPLGESDPDIGIYATGGLKHRWEIGSTVAIIQKLGFRYYEAPSSPEYGCIADYRFNLAWKIYRLIKWGMMKHVTADIPVVKANFPLSNQHETKERGPEVAIGAGLTIKF
jgi:hypothetical protein